MKKIRELNITMIKTSSQIMPQAKKYSWEDAQTHIYSLRDKISELDLDSTSLDSTSFELQIDSLISTNKLLQDSVIEADFRELNSPLVQICDRFESSINLLRDRYSNIDLTTKKILCDVVSMMHQIVYEYCMGTKTNSDWLELQNNIFEQLNQHLTKSNDPFNLDDTSEAFHLFDIDFDLSSNEQLYPVEETSPNNLDVLNNLNGFLLIQVDEQESSESFKNSQESSTNELTVLFPDLLAANSVEESEIFPEDFYLSSDEVKLPKPELLKNIFSDASTDRLLGNDDETELQGVNWNGKINATSIEDDFENVWTKLYSPQFWSEIDNIETATLKDLESSFDLSNDEKLLETSISNKFLEQLEDDNMFWNLSESIGDLETNTLADNQLLLLSLPSEDNRSMFVNTNQDEDFPSSNIDTAIEESPIYQNNASPFRSFLESHILANDSDKEISLSDIKSDINIETFTTNANPNDTKIRISLNHIEISEDLSEELLIRKGSLDIYLDEIRNLAEESNKNFHLLDSQSANQKSTAIANSQHTFDRLLNAIDLAKQQTNLIGQDARSLREHFHQILKYPISSIVRKFPRILHDLSLQNGKNVELIVHGADIGIERVLSDIITESLEILLRHACEYGIEPPSERQHQGKALQGNIEIIANQTDDTTIIKIADDGSGLGNLSNNISSLEGGDILNDMRNRLWEFGGTITVHSEIGKGTEYTIALPNTLSLMRVLLIDVDRMCLAIPSKSVIEVISIESSANLVNNEMETLSWRDRSIPIVRIDTLLKLNCRHSLNQASSPTSQLLKSTKQVEGYKPANAAPSFLVIQHENEIFVLQTDGCWNDQEATFHQIEGDITLSKIFSGAVILGSNHAVALLNLSELISQRLTLRSQNIALSHQDSHPSLADLSSLSNFFDADDRSSQVNSEVNSKSSLDSVDITRRFVQASEPENLESSGLLINDSGKVQTMKFPQPKILIVEFSANVRRYLAMTLSKSGFLTEQVQDAKEAIAFLTERSKTGLDIDIVITDLEMPQMEGFKLLSDIRADEALQDLPIVVLTARNNENDRKLALDLGANAYFNRPYREQELVKTLHQIIAS